MFFLTDVNFFLMRICDSICGYFTSSLEEYFLYPFFSSLSIIEMIFFCCCFYLCNDFCFGSSDMVALSHKLRL